MRYLEFRRHAPRNRPTEHLSQTGVNLARRLGERIGPFDQVITSPSLWTYATAIAMGFAVDEIYHPVEAAWERLADLLPVGATFAHIAHAMREHPAGADLQARLVEQWRAVAEALPDGARALVITHGGYIDYIAVACLPEADHARWGDVFGHGEGLRLAYDGKRFLEDAILRL